MHKKKLVKYLDQLGKRDGMTRVLTFNTYERMMNEFSFTKELTDEANEVLTMLQERGYEILDVKMSSVYEGNDSGLFGVNILVTYQ